MSKTLTFLWFPHHYNSMVEAVSVVIERLSKHRAPGNEKVKEKLTQYEWLRTHLSSNTPPEGEGSRAIVLSLGSLSHLKSALLELSQKLARDREHVLSTADIPEGATEGIDRKIQWIKDFTEAPDIKDLPVDEFLAPVKRVATPLSTLPLIEDLDLGKTVRKLEDADNGANDRAMSDACVVLEDRIRSLAGLPKGTYGEGLLDKAFRPTDGALILSDVAAEQDGWWQLYKGFMKAIRNPTGHRRVPASKLRAAQVISFADFLIVAAQDAEKRSP